jgi:hypothetical protein
MTSQIEACRMLTSTVNHFRLNDATQIIDLARAMFGLSASERDNMVDWFAVTLPLQEGQIELTGTLSLEVVAQLCESLIDWMHEAEYFGY